MLDETCWIDRFADIKFSSNTRPTFIQHDGKVLDEMLDQFNSALRLVF